MQTSRAVQEKTACLCCGSLHRGRKGKQRKELNEACPRNKLICMSGLTKVFGKSAIFVCFKHGTGAVEASGSVSILECCDIQPEWLGRRKRSGELFLFSGYAPLKVDYHKLSEASKNRYTTLAIKKGSPIACLLQASQKVCMPAHNGYDQSYSSVRFLPFFLLRIEAGRSDTSLRFQPWDIADMKYVHGHKPPIKKCSR